MHVYTFEHVDYFAIKGIKGDSPLVISPHSLFYFRNNKKVPLRDIKQIKNVSDQDSIMWDNIQYGADRKWRDAAEREYTICILGDSVSVFDWREFKDLIATRCGLNATVCVFAWPGYDLPQLRNVFEFGILPLKPNVVIYNYYQNDTNQHQFVEKDGTLFICYSHSSIPYIFESPFNNFLLAHSKLYNFINKRIAGYLQSRFRSYQPKYFYPGYQRSYQCLSDIISLCQKNGIILVMVNFPDIRKNFPTDDFIKRIAENYNLKYFDIRDKFIALGYNNDENFLKIKAPEQNYAHYNAAGFSLIRNLFFDYLLEQKILALKK